MKDRLKDYLLRQGAKALKPEFLEDYITEMNEQVIPNIVEAVQERELLAAELRYSPTATQGTARKDTAD